MMTAIDETADIDRRPALSMPELQADPRAASGTKQSKIMIADDEATNVKIAQRFLELDGYSRFLTTTDSTVALDMIRSEQPDVILLDLMMPHVSGLEILEEVRGEADVGRTPVIILTAMTDRDTRLKALELGATDFLHKPVDPSELVARVRNVLLVKSYQDRLENYNQDLATAVRQRTAELEASRQDVIHCLARAAEYRDDDTGHHVIRVGKYARLIGEGLGLDDDYVNSLEQAAQLHDIGKIGVPDTVLLKQDKLTEEEFSLMRKHTGFGKKILHRLPPDEEDRLRDHANVGGRILEVGSSPLLDLARTISLTHHEWWDGSGYPLGLKGEDIPLPGRITAVADVFDALSTRRCYKLAYPLEECFAIMEEKRRTHFDPRVLDAFLQVRDKVVAIQLRYADEC